MVLIGTWFATFVASRINDPARMITLGFVVLSLPGLALELLSFFARAGQRWELTWTYRIAGAGVLFFGVLAVQNVVVIG